MIIGIVNNKGGVGKTTTAVNLAAALAGPKRRVLLVDLDSEASASLWCGVPRERLSPSSADFLLRNLPIQNSVRGTDTAHLDLITASMDLASADLILCDVAGREATLRNALRPLRKRYDAIILDCPPSLSLVGINALVAADGIIIPVTPQFLVLEGLASVLKALERVRQSLGAKGRLAGILLNMAGPAPGAAAARDLLQVRLGDRMFQTGIEMSRTLEEAAEAHEPVTTFAPGSPSADAFRRLAGEVLQRMN